jgi:hypothetical protein
MGHGGPVRAPDFHAINSLHAIASQGEAHGISVAKGLWAKAVDAAVLVVLSTPLWKQSNPGLAELFSRSGERSCMASPERKRAHRTHFIKTAGCGGDPLRLCAVTPRHGERPHGTGGAGRCT